jgi:gamma-glutamyl:cysteine ligase YbdK (ATP-grasp superfamily)
MSLFDPRTFSTDWEVFLLDKLERRVSEDKLAAFAGYLTRVCDLPVQTDWDALEFAMGINTSFAQLWGRLQQVTDRAAQLAGEFDLDLFPTGAHPTDWLLNASHIHIGTIHDETGGVGVQTRLLKYTPVFAAIASNSPVSNHYRTGFKSQRVRRRANWCSRPDTVRDPKYFQYHWGTDACQQLPGKPTLEIRVTDCASSRRFLAELATFVAAYVHHQGRRAESYCPSPQEYRDCLTNRWSASRHGLQATFLWDGGAGSGPGGRPIGSARPVAEIADEMLDDCREELAALGVSRSDLGILNTMLAKRTCQSDWVLTVHERYEDPYLFASAYAKLLRHWEIFEEWLESAPALEPAPAPDAEAILTAHRDAIGEGTYFWRTRELMGYPPPAADALLEQMIERGEIRREVTTNRGTVLHRLR